MAAGCICAGAWAQQPSARVWSLGDCIEYALEQNIQLQQREITVEDQQNALNATRMTRLPNINGSVSENFNFGRAQNREGIYEDRSSANTSMGVNASVTVFQGLRILQQTKADKLSLEAAAQDLAQAKSDLSLQITAAYLQVLYAKENENVAIKQVEISEKLLERTRKMVEGGKTSQSELYNAESSLASAQSSLVDAVNSRQTAVLDLVQQMNFRDYSDFDIQVPEYDMNLEAAILALSPVDSIYNDYIEMRPSVIAAQKRVEQANRRVKVAQSSWYPSINVGASYSTGYYSTQAEMGGADNGFFKQLGRNATPSLGISMSIPLFDRLSTHYNVKTAKNAVRTQKLNLERERQTVYKEVQQAYVNAKAAYGKYQASTKSLDAAQKAFEFEEKKFEAGRSTAYQYNEVRSKLANAESQLAQAKYSFILRAKILDFYKGEPLY